ncbi:MAG: hypothetical protein P4K86_06510 [Terracidiphilus sp.]|nr:hypothetical protein [Terracidiphilus sp.]
MQLSKGVQEKNAVVLSLKSGLNLFCFAGTTYFPAVRSALPKRSNSAWRQKMHTLFISSAITLGSEVRHVLG